MELTSKYRQDTAGLVTQLDQSSDSFSKSKLKTGPSQIAQETVQVNDTNLIQTIPAKTKIETPKILTKSQQRYRWWQQEQKLVIGDSRYLKPIDDVNISYTGKVVDKNLLLPNRQLEGENMDWLTILLIATLILFATVRSNFSNYITNLFKSVFNYSTSVRMYQEQNYSVAQGAFRLEVYFYLTFSVFLFQIFRYFHVDLSLKNFALYLFSLVLVLLYFLGKKMLYRMIGTVTEGEEETSEYLYNLDNINRTMGLVLFPIVLLITFYPRENVTLPVILGVFTVLVSYFILIYKGIVILLRKQFSIFYLFLYFCTLEFLPLVLLYKIVVL